ncbi:MAG: DUF559 domain-containing protein [Candidatus Liptonbacteria bacterium]|nr:DUF559 domain-containing protein [Candidatus Liptonbacteria bacterium]
MEVHKYPKKEGGGFSYVVNDFIKGHSKRGPGGFDQKIHRPRLCACGCGNLTKKHRGRFSLFIKGHENINRVPWNKNKRFPAATRAKMSLARLGWEPYNKLPIDKEKLRRLYVIQKKSINQVSQILDISRDAIKNRLRAFGWSRTTKDSCSLPAFRDRMRILRVRALTSQKSIETPNKLEKLVYSTLDKYEVDYQRQASLFDKFVVDILFPKRRLVLEILGRYWHQNPKIRKKDYSKKRYLEKCGYEVEELWDYEIKKIGIQPLLEGVLEKYHLI